MNSKRPTITRRFALGETGRFLIASGMMLAYPGCKPRASIPDDSSETLKSGNLDNGTLPSIEEQVNIFKSGLFAWANTNVPANLRSQFNSLGRKIQAPLVAKIVRDLTSWRGRGKSFNLTEFMQKTFPGSSPIKLSGDQQIIVNKLLDNLFGAMNRGSGNSSIRTASLQFSDSDRAEIGVLQERSLTESGVSSSDSFALTSNGHGMPDWAKQLIAMVGLLVGMAIFLCILMLAAAGSAAALMTLFIGVFVFVFIVVPLAGMNSSR